MPIPIPKAAVGAAIGGIVGAVQGALSSKPFSITPLKYTPSKGSLEEIKDEKFTIDAVLNEVESRSVSVTNYPLESGGSFAEHANQLAFNLSISGIISDASLSYLDTASAARSSALGGALGFPSKTQKAYDILTKWAETAQPLLVRTKFKQQGYYKGKGSSLVPVPFVIESFTVTRTKDIGSALSFSMVLREIRLISNVKAKTTPLAIIPTEKPSVTDQGSAGPNSGTKSDNATAKNKAATDNVALKKAQSLRDKGVIQ